MQSCYVVARASDSCRGAQWAHAGKESWGGGVIFQTYCWILEYVALLFWAVNWAGVK